MLDAAVASWTDAAERYSRAGRPADQVTALLQLSQAQSGLGRYADAVRTLEAALRVAADSGDRFRVASVLSALGNVHIVVGPPELAATYLDRALVSAREVTASALTAATLNNRGNLFATQGKHAEAVAAYRESIALAERLPDHALAARALSNAAASLRQTGQPREAEGMVDRAADHLQQMPPSHETAFALVTVGVAYRDLRAALPQSGDALALRAAQALNAAAASADGLGDRRTSSYAWGYLGGLYEDERRYAEALQLTRRAIFAAQQANAVELLYRWQRQAGRLLHRLLGLDVDGALLFRPALGAVGQRAVEPAAENHAPAGVTIQGPRADFDLIGQRGDHEALPHADMASDALRAIASCSAFTTRCSAVITQRTRGRITESTARRHAGSFAGNRIRASVSPI